MNIDLDHFETLEELERDLMSWIKEEDIYSFDRYLNKEDVLKIVQMLIRSNLEIERLNNIINELEKKLLELRLTDVDGKTIVYRLLDKLQELKGSDK